MKDFYKILGVSENATQDEIKKAYRKLVVQHHPDKGGDENKFKEISEAYDTIGNDEKRKQYDNAKQNPFSQFGQGFSYPFDIFNRGGYKERRKSAPEKIITINVGALESFLGSEKTISYYRKNKCNTCDGKGGDRHICGNCKGDGFNTIKMGTGIFSQVFRQSCGSCKGKGYTLTNVCGTCKGETTINMTETLKVKVPSNVDNGQFLRIVDKGDFHNNEYGNLVLQINIVPENNFEKEGNNLIYHAIFNKETLMNDKYKIPHPSGELIITLPNTFDTSKPLRIKSKGYNNVGDLYVNLIVRFNRN
jgi:molecular chaperone DnaJ